MNHEIDRKYTGLEWKDGGRSRDTGVDCAGLALLWYKEQLGLEIKDLETTPDTDVSTLSLTWTGEIDLSRGDAVFFRLRPSRKIRHVAIYLGDRKYLHIVKGGNSRIENGLVLLRRVGCEPAGIIPPDRISALAEALANKQIREVSTIVELVIAVVLAVVSYFLTPSLAGFKNRNGRYGDNALLTQKNPEIPLPDILGRVVVAGNSVYQQLPDKKQVVDNTPPQKWNQIIVLCSGPSEEVDLDGLQINGVSYQDKSFFEGDAGGVIPNPDQTKDEAVEGDIGNDTDAPTLTVYEGSHDISVPVDIRAQYDRNYPIYGFSGCTYLAMRLSDSSKFQNLNVTSRVKCRKCRTFDSSGFIATAVSAESLTGADGTKVRFKLAFDDIKAVSSLTVGATSYSEISASAQTGHVYKLNQLKGYVEFITAPAGGSSISIDYEYYPRAWTQNPASQIIYLLTDDIRGKGFSEDRISWPDAADARDYFDDDVTWFTTSGPITSDRYQANYSIDVRKPIQDHLQALLDASRSMLFLSGGLFYIKPRKSDSSIFSFNTSNILLDQGDSSFEATLLDRATKPNRIKLFYSSDETLNSETEADADDEDNQRARADRVGAGGVVEENLKYPAVTSQSQAERLAEISVRESVGSNYAYRWKTNIKGLKLQPGDVVDVTHPSLPSNGAVLMRIETIEHDADDHLVLKASEYVAQAEI